MIFVFNDSSPRSFTMKNTYIPLNIIFFDENAKFIKSERAYPHQKNNILCKKNAMYVIEIPF